MSNTWNFPCWTTRDQGPNYTRGNIGNVFELGPGASSAPATTQPFTGTITGIFSLLIRSGGWSNLAGATEGVFSIGSSGDTGAALEINVNTFVNPGGRSAILLYGRDDAGSSVKYEIYLGDDNGTDWMWWDKWYQVAFCMTPTGITYAVNGTNTPKRSEAINSPGTIDMDGKRIWSCAPTAAWPASDAITVNSTWPTMIFGASAWSTTALDMTDSTVLGRIYDTDGNFKNPGENGSLWFDSGYGVTIPEFYFTNGTPIHQNGSDTQTWGSQRGGGAGFGGCPGGLRKQYETVFPAGAWVYAGLSEAEASGDAWLEGDSVYLSGGAEFIYRAALAVDGYSGLIHKDPFNESTSVSSATAKISETASDPDTWAYTDAGTGGKGVAYEYDTNGGKARIRQLGAVGWGTLNSTALSEVGDDEIFAIFDLSDFIYTNGFTDHRFLIRGDGFGVYYGINYPTSTTNWTYLTTGAAANLDTNVAFGGSGRIFMYAKAGKTTMWSDIGKVPSFTSALITTAEAAGASMLTLTAAENNRTWAYECGIHLAGVMVTA